MAVNILEHEMVPKHEVLTPQEQKEVLFRFAVPIEKLPKIFTTDPIVRAIKAKPGDIIRITRRSLTAGEAVYFRAVIHPTD